MFINILRYRRPAHLFTFYKYIVLKFYNVYIVPVRNIYIFLLKLITANNLFTKLGGVLNSVYLL